VHAVDLMPTVLDACGVTPPDTVDGVTQQRFDGATVRATFGDAAAPDPRSVQYFEVLGSRSIVADGWKATTDHVSKGVMDEEELLEGSRVFADDTWSLFRLADDFSEAHDLAAEHPDVLRELQELWTAEAERNHVFPIVDELIGRFAAIIPPPNAPGERVVYRREGGLVPDESVARFFGGFRITADVELPGDGVEGILCAIGDWTGGCAFFVRDGRLVFALNRAGDAASVTAAVALTAGRHTLSCVYAPPGDTGPTLTLLRDDEVLEHAVLPIPVPMVWQHGGTMLALGHDRGLPVSGVYEPPFAWTGTLHEVIIDTGATARLDAREIARAHLHSE